MWNNPDGFQGAGGFDNTSNMFSSPQQQTDSKFSKPRCIADVAIRQILNSPEEGLKIKNAIDIQVVRICGVVKSIDVKSLKITYVIEDNTGEINGISFVDSNETDNTVPVVENTYCFIVGAIRSHGEEKSILIFHIYSATDVMQIIEHMLSVVYTNVKAENISTEMDVKQEEIKREMLSFGSSSSTIMSSSSSGMDAKIKRVYDVITRCTSETGIFIDDIKTTLKMSPGEIRDAIEHLTNEGHIFTTIDESHFKSTESF